LATIIAVIVGIGATGAWLWHSGYRAYVVHTGSMSPTYKPGALVIDKPAKDGYRPGQVITFHHSAQTTDVVTHRITDITSTGLIHTKGDANRTADVWDIRPDQVRGTVVAGVPFGGFVVVYLQQPAGIASAILALMALILLWGLWFPPEDGFLTAAEKRPATAEVMAWDVRVSPLRRLAEWRPGKLGGIRPTAPSRTAATAAAKVAIAGMVVVNVGGALTVIADQSAPPTVAPVAAGK
jgi:signal peptidase